MLVEQQVDRLDHLAGSSYHLSNSKILQMKTGYEGSAAVNNNWNPHKNKKKRNGKNMSSAVGSSSFSVQCVIIPLIARHGARKQAQTRFSSSVRHQQHLEPLWEAVKQCPEDSQKQKWSIFKWCLFICASDVNDS